MTGATHAPLRALSGFIVAVQGVGNEADLHGLVARHLPQLVPADRASVALRSDDGEWLEVMALEGDGSVAQPGQRLPFLETRAAAAVLARELHAWTPDAASTLVDEAACVRAGLRSVVNAPLVAGDTALGTINLASRRVNAYSPDDLALVEQVSAIVASALARLRLMAQVRVDADRQARYAERLEALGALAAGLTRARTATEAFSVVADGLSAAVAFDRVSFTLLEPDGQHLRIFAVVGADSALAAGSLVPVAGSGFEPLLSTGTTLVYTDLADSPFPEHRQLHDMGLVSAVIVPLCADRVVVGSVNVATRGADLLDPHARAVLEALARMLSSTLDRMRVDAARLCELSEVEERFQAISEASAIGFVKVGRDRTWQYTSPMAAAIIGADQKTPGVWLDLVHPDHRQAARAAWNGAVARFTADLDAPPFEFEYRKLHGSAHQIIRAVATPTRAASELTGFVVTLQDVTRQRESEERLRQTQKLESLGVLAGGLAHDFNNLLAAALGNLSLVEDTLGSDSAVHGELNEVRRALERGATLTRQMLAYAGKASTTARRVDVNRAVVEMARLLAASLPKTVEIRCDLSPLELPIHADVAQLDQLLLNLATNAAEAIGSRPGLVSFGTRVETLAKPESSERIPGHIVTAGRYALLTCADTGCGMAPDVLSRVFDPFFTTKPSGHGLGLSAALGIVRAHGGDIRVRSAPGHGTTFEVWLPCLTDLAGTTRDERRDRPLVLIVDDEEQVRRVVRHMLDRSGFRSISAHTAEEGLALLSKPNAEIALVLLDLSMPGMSGLEASAEIARRWPHVGCVLMTGFHPDIGTSEAVLAAGVGFLAKPFDLKDLRRAIADVVGRVK